MLNATSSPPSRVLIPEARDHQRRRYLRTGLAAVLVAFALAGLIAFLVVLTAGAAPGNRSREASRLPAAAGSRVVLVRPVLCAAPPFSASAAARTPSETCAAPYADTPASLDVQPRPGGFTWSERPPDPVLAADPTSTRDVPSDTVVLATTAGVTTPPGSRLLLGPSVMTLSRSTVASAAPHEVRARVWEVLVRLNASGSVRWDAAGHQFFHGLVAIDYGGRVVSTPLIQPTTASFSSFDGRLTVGGGLPHGEAVALAAALTATHAPG